VNEANRAAGEILASERLAEHQARGRKALSKRQAEDLGADVSDQALVDAFADGMSHKEIAQATSMTEAMVRTRLRRAHHRKIRPSQFKAKGDDDQVPEPEEEPSPAPPPPQPTAPVEVPEVVREEQDAPRPEDNTPEATEDEEPARTEKPPEGAETCDAPEDEGSDAPEWTWQAISKLSSFERAPSSTTVKSRAESDDEAWAHYEFADAEGLKGDWSPQTRTVYRLRQGTDFGEFGEAPTQRRTGKKRSKTTRGSARVIEELEARVKDLEASLADAVKYCDEFDENKSQLAIFKEAIDVLVGGEESEAFRESDESCHVVARAIVRKVRHELVTKSVVSHAERFEQLLSSMGEARLLEELEQDWSEWFQVRKERAGLSNAEIGECFGSGERTGRTLVSGGDPPLENADFATLARALHVDPSVLLAKSIVKRMGMPATVELARAAAATLDKERHELRRCG
jgi:hypothetical protein